MQAVLISWKLNWSAVKLFEYFQSWLDVSLGSSGWVEVTLTRSVSRIHKDCPFLCNAVAVCPPSICVLVSEVLPSALDASTATNGAQEDTGLLHGQGCIWSPRSAKRFDFTCLDHTTVYIPLSLCVSPVVQASSFTSCVHKGWALNDFAQSSYDSLPSTFSQLLCSPGFTGKKQQTLTENLDLNTLQFSLICDKTWMLQCVHDFMILWLWFWQSNTNPTKWCSQKCIPYLVM